MITRRFLTYFIVVTGFAVLATITFELVALGRAAQQAVDAHMAVAQSVARFVSGVLEHEGERLAALLDEAAANGTGPALRARLRHLREDAPDSGGVALLDAAGRTRIADLDAGGLPPPRVLLPALRHARGRGRQVVTDLWTGLDGRPRIAIVVGADAGAPLRAAVLSVPLDGKDFQRLFRYFVVSEPSRIQLLDSRGTALFSSEAVERFRSVVHGTYLSDRVRLGLPVSMRCHSCHEGTTPEEGPIRRTEITSVAPVPGTEWAVTVRERTAALFAPVREIAISSIALVSIIIGAFVGYFLLLSRHVLRPLRQLVEVASSLRPGDHPDLPAGSLPAGSDFAPLANALETASRRLRRDEPQPETPPQHALDPVLRSVLSGLVRIRPVCAAMLLLEAPAPRDHRVHAEGLTVPETAVPALLELGSKASAVSRRELRARGIELDLPPDTRTFLVERIQILGSLRGQLWIGTTVAAEDLGAYLLEAITLVAANIQHLVVRTTLHERLIREHGLKARMVRHLFEVEDEERRRIARELHDEPAQVLNALLLALETFPGPEDPEAQARCLAKAKGYTDRLMDTTDRLIRQLRPAILDDLGLEAAIRAAGRQLLEEAGLRFDLQVTGDLADRLSKEAEVAVYRIFHEAFTNILRHAGAHRVAATLEVGEDRLQATIEDDGAGMDLSRRPDDPAHPAWGLLGMQERAGQLGGTIAFARAPGGGVRVAFDIPLDAAGEVHDEDR